MPMFFRTCFTAILFLALACATAQADEPAALTLIDPVSPEAAGQIKPNENFGDTQFEVTETGINVAVKADGKAGYPGLAIRPADGKAWDLARYGHIEARITNTGESRIHASLRIDNPGHHTTQPWNTEAKAINPGQTETIKVIFGYAHGFKPSFKLDPANITGALIFIGKSKSAASFRIESLTAAGQAGEVPPINPAQVRIIPENGVILGQGTDISKNMKIGVSDASYDIVDDAIQFTFPANKTNQRVAIRTAVGRWNLRDHLQAEITVTNTGDAPIALRAQIESDKGPSDWIAAAELAPGASDTITVPFRSERTWQGPPDLSGKSLKGTDGSLLASNVVSGFILATDAADAPRTVRVEKIVASMPSAASLPEWLGKRPPVEGDWTMTLEDNFDGDTLDFTRWNIYTSNFWDKRSHFSRDNVILSDGVVRLRFEKKSGPHNDDPAGKVTSYATGYLGTYGKWVQRYGYFEARMKLPKAPGMWPAFWLMPDRGIEAGPQWKRADTANGGMEFDIMEYLSRWGPNRHTVAFHWDGYGKGHKATGAAIYVAPDADGYITSGLLWEPGRAVVYCNGQEVARWETPRISDVPSYPIFTAVSGGWDNDPIDDAQLPSDFVIDYIRIWQRSDLASDLDGPKPNDGGPLPPQ